jgi:thiol-disulfide isomerase/thioredoxin
VTMGEGTKGRLAVVGALAAVVVAAVVLGVLALRGPHGPRGSTRVGADAPGAGAKGTPCRGEACRPPLAGPTLAGERLEAADLDGKVVLVNYWATWCAPCVAEMPELEAVHQTYRDRGFRIVGVLTDDPAADAEVRGFLERVGATFAVVREHDALAPWLSRLDALPISELYDRDGRLARRWRGPVTEHDLAAAVARILAP